MRSSSSLRTSTIHSVSRFDKTGSGVPLKFQPASDTLSARAQDKKESA